VLRLVSSLMVTLVISIPVHGQEYLPLLDQQLRDLLYESLSGELAKDHVLQISRHHRIQGSRGYRAAAQYVLGQLRSYGFGADEAHIESFPSDGRVAYQTWQSPAGWDIESAELRMVEPDEERIVGYPEIAMSLMTYSNPGEVTAELVWVGNGTSDSDYEGKNVAGKFVLATGYGGDVHRLAVLKHGAAAVVAYLDDERAAEHPDMLQYTGMWPRGEELDRVTFGFNLTNRQGERLRDMLLSGQRVVLKGQVSGIGLESYFMDAVVARIPGADHPEEQLVICAHLDHPKESANDNASGSAAILDIARAVKGLIDDGRLPRPKRSLTFLWIAEWNGTMAYIDRHPEMQGPALGGGYLANLNLDMVGENLELLHSRMNVTRLPASLPSTVSDVVANMTEMVSRMDIRTPRGSLSDLNFRITPYSGGSDHMMFIDRKIPGIMIGHSDYAHHTSEDTPDKVDPVELERSEIIAAATTLYLSDLTAEQAVDLVFLTGANGARRLGEAARRARRQMHLAGRERETAGGSWFEVENTVSRTARWEREAVSSVLHFNRSAMVERAVEGTQQQLKEQEKSLLATLRAEAATTGIEFDARGIRQTDERVPVRLTRGPLDLALPVSHLPAADAAWYASREFDLTGDERFELVNFIDGTRSVSDIRDALSAEFRPIQTQLVARYLSDLVRVGVVSWRQ